MKYAHWQISAHQKGWYNSVIRLLVMPFCLVGSLGMLIMPIVGNFIYRIFFSQGNF